MHAKRKGIKKRPRAKKKWTPEDDRLLADSWGTVSVGTIARKLGRSKSAILVRKNRIGLGAFLDCGDDPPLNQVYTTIYGGSRQGGYNMYAWLENGLPYREKVVDSCRFRVINLDEFWEWAEKHKQLMNFARFEKYGLGAEPAWVDVKRKADHDERVKTQPHNKQWSPSDDLTLKRMLARGGYTWTEIASEAHRTEGACRRRAMDLGVDTSLVRRNTTRKWTDAEVREMLAMKMAGHSYRQIGDKLGRGARSVEGKYERLINPEYYNQANRKSRMKTVRYIGVKGVCPAVMLEAYENGYHEVAFREAVAYGGEET